MILENVKMIGNDEPVDILICNGKIADIYSAGSKESNEYKLTFDNAIIFPGLINSHDHLDFNLFPQLGNKTYNNYTEWGTYIHKNYKEEISRVLKIPALLRAQWGIFKNLLCGVTTVINHGAPSGINNKLITVFEKTHCLHSVGFEKNWKLKLNNPLKRNLPVNIHTGEGTNLAAATEIDQLIKWNLLNRALIGTHGVAMTAEQATQFKALVWCPESNNYLLNKTADVDVLGKHTNILFGTDSTLTSSWNIWDHLRLAQKTKLLNNEELYATLNENPVNAWQLNSGEIAVGKNADLVVARAKDGVNNLDGFFSLDTTDLLLVVHQGNIRLFDDSLAGQVNTQTLDFGKVYINNTCKNVQGDLPDLMEKIQAIEPSIHFPVTTNKQADHTTIHKTTFTSADIDTF